MLSYRQLAALVGIAILMIVGLLTVVFQIMGWIDIMASLTDIWIWIAAGFIGIALALITGKRGIKSPYESETQIPSIDSRFRHLAFHYSRITDTPKTLDPLKPNYVVNIKTNEAFPIPKILEPYLKSVTTNWRPHNGEAELNKHFNANKIHRNRNDPKLEDLELVLGGDGFLHLLDLDLNKLLAKLNGRKIKGRTVIKIYPWYRYFRSKPRYTNRRLLLEHSSNKVFWSPFHDQDLIDNQSINSDISTRLPLEPFRFWSWRHHYHYVPERYDEDKLLTGE